jgi:hypothetical protein
MRDLNNLTWNDINRIRNKHPYPRAFELYRRGEAEGWYVYPTWVFVACFVVAVTAYWYLRHPLVLIPMLFFYGAAVKRRGLSEGFMLGYETGYYDGVDEAFGLSDEEVQSLS